MDVKVIIEGKEYPCRATMGAMIKFRRETGKEVSEIKQGEVSLLCIWFWCCTASACAADGVPFSMSCEEFADRLTTDDLEKIASQLEPAGDAKKKTTA